MGSSVRQKLTNIVFHYLGTIQEPWYSWVNALANLVIRLRKPERIIHPGDLHPDRTFYIIDDLSPYVGLAGWYDRILGYMLRAKRKGWTPIVVPCPPAQADDGDWTAFFDGPTAEIPVSEALQGKNVVRATPQGMIHKRYNRKNIAMRHPLCAEVPLSAEAQAVVDKTILTTFGMRKTATVGVMFRGTDYRAIPGCTAIGHAKVPDIAWFCQRIREDMSKWGIEDETGECLYVVTEEQEALDAIQHEFPDCTFVHKERYANFKSGKWLAFQRLPNTTPRDNNFLYLADIVSLSRCQYLIGGVNGCVLMALNLNGNRYKGIDILNTGAN